jgi:hypothetical protein
MKRWNIFQSGQRIATVSARTSREALSIAREQTGYSRLTVRRANPSRIGKRVMVARRKKAATERRVASALATYLKRLNPGRKLAGAKVQKLAGGVIKITPVKLNRRRR